MMTIDIEAERKAFESGFNGKKPEIDSATGEYINSYSRVAWEAWQARAALVASQQEPESHSMVAIARRNLASYLSKASFASSVDRQAALNCLDVLGNAALNEGPAITDEEILAEADLFSSGRVECSIGNLRTFGSEMIIAFARAMLAKVQS